MGVPCFEVHYWKCVTTILHHRQLLSLDNDRGQGHQGANQQVPQVARRPIGKKHNPT